MAETSGSADEPVRIKKYANRRLYNTATSTYVTLEDLAKMVKNGSDFVVNDAKTGEDITHAVLTQIIFEQEGKGHNLLPISFLRQLIRFYGDSMQALVPSYLEISLERFAKEQDRMRQQMAQTFGAPFEMMEEQVRKNMAMVTEAMTMFSPFKTADPNSGDEASRSSQVDEIRALREQLKSMQSQLDKISRGK